MNAFPFRCPLELVPPHFVKSHGNVLIIQIMVIIGPMANAGHLDSSGEAITQFAS
jgi:hypothetical protein